MRPIRIGVKNFGSYKKECVNFENLPSVFAVVGNNGSGKSTIFIDALTFALFNRARGLTSTGSGIENLIHMGEDFLEVELEFEMNENIYRIIRRRSTNTHELELYINGTNHSEKIKETEAKIRGIIKMDYDTLLDTVCIHQKGSSAFMDKKPNERKAVFADVLNLHRYDVLEEEAKGQRRLAKERIARVKNRLNDLGNLDEQFTKYEDMVENGDNEMATLNTELEDISLRFELEISRRSTYEAKLHEYNEILERQRFLSNRVVSMEKDVIDGEKKFKEYDDEIKGLNVNAHVQTKLQDELDDIQLCHRDLINERSELRTSIRFLEQTARELKERFVHLRDHGAAQCDFCLQEITSITKEQSLAKFKQDGIDAVGKAKGHGERLAIVEDEILKCVNKERELKIALDDYNGQVERKRNLNTKLAVIESRLVDLKLQLEDVHIEHATVMSKQLPDIKEQVFRDNEYREQLNRIHKQITALKSNMDFARRELGRLKGERDEVRELDKQLIELQMAYEEYDELAYAFSKQGIQAIIIESALPEIEMEINDVLQLLTTGRVSIEFLTQKEKKTKKKNEENMVETLDILVHDEKGTRVYEVYSGGEQFKVDFACHVGLARYLARRAGANIKFFILDENVGSQDRDAKELLLRSIEALGTMFEHVIIISHIEDFVEGFDHRLLVYKDPKVGSKIRLLS